MGVPLNFFRRQQWLSAVAAAEKVQDVSPPPGPPRISSGRCRWTRTSCAAAPARGPERIDRPSASEGERRAAEWLVDPLRELGAEARIEAEPAHGTFWWPLGIGAARECWAGSPALRGRRLLGAALGALAAAGIADDFPPGHRLLRRVASRAAPPTSRRVGPRRRGADGRPHRPPRRRPLRPHRPPRSSPNIADRPRVGRNQDTSPPLIAPASVPRCWPGSGR